MAEHERWMELASRQHGVVSRSQLAECGLTSKAVRHGVATHRFEWLSSRVLRAAGSPATALQRLMAATLDVTDGAVALDSALALWEVPGWWLEPAHVLTGRRPHRGGFHLGVVHSSVRLTDDDIGEAAGLRVTTPVRTLVDMSSRLRPEKLGGLCDDLLRRRLLTVPVLHRAVGELPRRGGPTGYGALRRVARMRPEGYQPTDSRLERRFEVILERSDEEPFERQVDVGDEAGWIGRVDFADRRLKVIVEVQSDLYHSSLSDRRRDRERLARLRAAGWTVVEVFEEEIWSLPDRVLAKVRAARAHAAASAA